MSYLRFGMREWKRALAVLLMIAGTAAGTGCSEDEGPVAPTTFALLLSNRTPYDLEVFRRSSTGDAFVKAGVSVSNATYRINPLSIGTTYTFRLSRQGGGPDVFDYERTVSSTGADVAWEVK
jgi:hypothetical protein